MPEIEGTLFEVCQDSKLGYCRILQCMDDLKEKYGEKAIDEWEGKLTHMSTWIQVVNNPELVQKLKAIEGALLVRLNIRLFGNDEFELKFYDCTTVRQLVDQLSIFCESDFKVKCADGQIIKRIDNKEWNK